MNAIPGEDGKLRCAWAYHAPDFPHYHDTEWGFPVTDDQRLFEKLSLEAFQSGLSWRTILSKRDNFRAAFHDFDFRRIARFTGADVERLLQDAGIIRHRGKIEAIVNNARCMVELTQRQSLASVVWAHEPPRRQATEVTATSPESIALAKELKAGGWKFVGPTTAYAFMQAMGLVNDHVAGCFVAEQVEAARRAMTPPQQ